MLAFPSMIADIAKKSGMKVPKKPDEKWDFQKYLHFGVFCEVTLGRPLNWHNARTAMEENAKMIAEVPIEDLKKMTLAEIRGRCVDLG